MSEVSIKNGEGKIRVRLHNGRWQWWYGGDAMWCEIDYYFPMVETLTDAWRLALYMTLQAIRGNFPRPLSEENAA